jgi:uncharacterized membrane protein
VTQEARHGEDPSLARIGAFSDGVFAFAITLLVLAIRIPRPTDTDASHGLLPLLTQQWRSYLAFVLSFMFVGINWTNHRVMFQTFARANHTLVWLNLIYLMTGAAFMPVPTAVLGYWMGSPHNQVVAAVFYGVSATVGGLTYNFVWWYGAYIGKLTLPTLSAAQRRAHSIAWAPAPFVAAALTGIAFANPQLAVVGFIVTVFVYVLPLPRLIALKREWHRRRRR